MVDNKYTLYKCIQIIGEHPSPFPFLAVTVLDNTVLVVHSIQHLTVPFEDDHLHKGEPIAFTHDIQQKTSPRILKYDEMEFKMQKNGSTQSSSRS